MTHPDLWSARRPLAYGFVTVLILIGGFGLWSSLATITGAIVTTGRVEVEQRRQIVQHPDGGVVQSIHVSEGRTVKAGDLLVRLDGAALRSELAIVEGQMFELLARRGRLEAERDDSATPTFPADLIAAAALNPDVAGLAEGQRRLFAARADTLAQQVARLEKRRAQITHQITGMAAQGDALVTQLALIDQELVAQQKLLSKGLTQAGRVLALQRDAARLQGQSGEITAARAQAEGHITEIEIEALGLAAARREDANTQMRDLGYREMELAERRRALSGRIARLEVRAPVSGIVLGLQVTTPRAVLRAAEPLMYLIPQDRQLVIAAKVPPVHIDQVSIGQSVTLVFSAFSTRSTPHLHGHVSGLSADTLSDDRNPAPYYRAEIALDPAEVVKLRELSLIPGMPVEVFLRTGARTPLAYLIKPFTDYFARALRET